MTDDPISETPTTDELMGMLDAINIRFAQQQTAILALSIGLGAATLLLTLLWLRARGEAGDG